MHKLFILCSIVFSLAACSFRRVDGVERTRVSSPDGVVDAVLIEKQTGATVASPTELYVTPKGEWPTSTELVMRADHATGLSIGWRESRIVDVSYETARIHQFKNFWMASKVQNFTYIVEARLKPTRDSTSLGPP